MPDDPVQDQYRAALNAAMDALTKAFPGQVVTLLLTAPGHQAGRRINYISNGRRDDIKAAMKEVLARWEGRLLPGLGGPPQ